MSSYIMNSVQASNARAKFFNWNLLSYASAFLRSRRHRFFSSLRLATQREMVLLRKKFSPIFRTCISAAITWKRCWKIVRLSNTFGVVSKIVNARGERRVLFINRCRFLSEALARRDWSDRIFSTFQEVSDEKTLLIDAVFWEQFQLPLNTPREFPCEWNFELKIFLLSGITHKSISILLATFSRGVFTLSRGLLRLVSWCDFAPVSHRNSLPSDPIWFYFVSASMWNTFLRREKFPVFKFIFGFRYVNWKIFKLTLIRVERRYLQFTCSGGTSTAAVAVDMWTFTSDEPLSRLPKSFSLSECFPILSSWFAFLADFCCFYVSNYFHFALKKHYTKISNEPATWAWSVVEK